MGEAAGIWDREAWQRHPAGLIYVTVAALLTSNLLNLHAMSAAAIACILALAAMIFQMLREPDHSSEVYFLAARFLLPFVIQIIRRALKP